MLVGWCLFCPVRRWCLIVAIFAILIGVIVVITVIVGITGIVAITVIVVITGIVGITVIVVSTDIVNVIVIVIVSYRHHYIVDIPKREKLLLVTTTSL